MKDSQAVIQYGALAQNEVSKFSDAILGQIRAKDSGEVGTVLTDLLTRVQEVDVDSLDPNKQGFFDRLFEILKGNRQIHGPLRKLSVQIEKIIDQLERAKLQLIRDITALDTMYAKNLEYLKELDIYIMAGSLKLKELTDKVLPRSGKRPRGLGTLWMPRRLRICQSLSPGLKEDPRPEADQDDCHPDRSSDQADTEQ